MSVIDIKHVTKVYPARRGTRVMLGRGGLGDWLRGRKTATFAALRDISLEVGPGESLGIIGRNGSGKSTLLKILAGVTLPTSGEVIVRGRVASLLELGAGFHPMLTGRENVYLNAGLLGMRHAQVDEVFDQIVAFSGIGEFIDQPVDTYSSGMYVRIGFAVAAHTNPDIFLVDEVLSVGDEDFQRKCRRRIGELREQGKTIVFVSHDLGTVNTLCRRVVLLNKGEMVVRDTPQKTINFYLRQVGRDRGVHTFTDGAIEAIHCDGRLSLFARQEEITASTGCQMALTSLGQRHFSSDAEWELTEAGESCCRAQGRMTRLPVRFDWRMELEAGRLTWHAAIECEHAVELSLIELMICLPTSYLHWLYGDYAGRFPDILPADSGWNVVVAPEVSAHEAAALPEEGAALPPLMFRLTPHLPHMALYWANSEYVSFSRLLIPYARFPEENCVFSAGRHDIVTLTIDTTTDRARIRERMRTERSLQSGRLTARFELGKVRVSYDEEELTAALHLYSSILMEHLWHDSISLQWSAVRSDGRRLAVSGASRRFPFRQDWEMEAVEGGFALRIWVEALEPFDAQEYHVSAVLRAEYENWETDHESGVFPPFDRTMSIWKHLNRTYAPGCRAQALSSRLPSVIFEVTAQDMGFRMTPLNTGHDQHARVLQALRPSDMSPLHFDAGRHLYFSGRLLISPCAEPQVRQAPFAR